MINNKKNGVLPKIQQRVGINLILFKMKNYKKVKMMAKNAPSGSYAAGCGYKDRKREVKLFASKCGLVSHCVDCERTA